MLLFSRINPGWVQVLNDSLSANKTWITIIEKTEQVIFKSPWKDVLMKSKRNFVEKGYIIRSKWKIFM